MNERDPLFLRDMLDAIAAVERYTKTGREAFLANQLIQDAVMRQLVVMGEAAHNVSSTVKDTEAAVPWSRLSDTHDHMIHDYCFNPDLNVVWAMVERDLAPLKREIARIVGQT